MKIGFIDYYLDNWHAAHFPAMVREQSGGKWEVTCAWALMDSPLGGKANAQWCRDMGIRLCGTEEEVICQSDVLVVLSPENGHMHQMLSEKALRSGKPTYIDKTLAPTRQMAQAIMDIAEACGTSCFSSSALRFAQEYQPFWENTSRQPPLWAVCD